MSEPIIIDSHSTDDTINAAQQCANMAKKGDIITLSGPMGAGKSEFARGFICHLMGADIEVPSPTFTLVQTYDSPTNMIWHFDLYRLENAEEIYEIGWEDALNEGIMLIEWPERLGHLMPARRTEIIITPKSENNREIHIINHGDI